MINKKHDLNRKERVILEELVSKYGQDTLLEAINYRKILPYVLAGGIAVGGAKGINTAIQNHRTEHNQEKSNPYGMTKPDYELFLEKLDSVVTLIDTNLKKNGKSIDHIQFDPKHVVYLCYKYNFDLPLMLAQMQCESHFGTDPRAQRTGSVISIGQWDNKTVVTYGTQDECFEPYIKIMKRDYLQNGKVNVDDLLKAGKFVNKDNKRYAKNPHYERDIRVTRNKIIRDYPVLAKEYSVYNMPEI